MTTYNGILLVDKPRDLTSHDVVHKIRKNLQIKHVGHAGTLDPLASGLLVLLLGEATKISDFLISGDKAYECEVELGKTTDTLDITGKVLSETDVNIKLEEVIQAVKSLEGKFEWDIPLYSAKKVKGKKLYELARKGEKPEVAPKKEMHFKNVELLSYEPPFVKVRLSCSKGSFIRTWANELGKVLGTGACMSGLRRIKSSSFQISNALSLNNVKGANIASPAYISMEKALEDIPSLEVKDFDAHLVRHGQISQTLQARLQMVHRYFSEQNDLKFKVTGEGGRLLALVHRAKGGRYRFSRVFRA